MNNNRYLILLIAWLILPLIIISKAEEITSSSASTLLDAIGDDAEAYTPSNKNVVPPAENVPSSIETDKKDFDFPIKDVLPDIIEKNREPKIIIENEIPLEKLEEISATDLPPIAVYLGEFLNPWEYGNPDELIDFNLDNAELSVLITYIEKRFKINFILDDALSPKPQGGQSILGSKISFKTHEPLSKQDAWSIFVTFLDMAGLSPVPGPMPGTYRITSNNPTSPLGPNKSPLPLFIGVNTKLLPNDDMRIRYIYFVENTSLEVIREAINSMQSVTAPKVTIFPELRAVIMTDKASSIRAILEVIQELDKANTPETLTIIKLKHTDAAKVAELYATLAKAEDQSGLAARLFGARKQSSTSYFSPNTRVIAEPRTNTLILIGNEESVKKIEDFIVQNIDRQYDLAYSPLHVRPLKHVEATAIAQILQNATQFQRETDAAKFGGVRDGNQYFKPISIIPEPSGNRLIINADYEDYLRLDAILNKIDVEQPQVAIKVLILNIDLTDNLQLGVQMRNKKPGPNGLLGNNTNFQTSGLNGSGVVENTNTSGANRLLGNLIDIVTSSAPGSTVLTLGSDAFGVWGLLQMLETYTRVSVVANPFLVTTHKYTASISIGETRRVITSTTIGANAQEIDNYGSLAANLEVKITPQVSLEGLITLDVAVELDQFTNAADQTDGNRTEKTIQTAVIVNNNEVLALGGLIKDTENNTQTGVPILQDIPIIGWLFKNKTKQILRSSLLVLIAPEVIPPEMPELARQFTQTKLSDTKSMLNDVKQATPLRDPIHRWFFKDNKDEQSVIVNDFFDEEARYVNGGKS